MNELIAKVLQWGIDKGITGPNGKGTLLAQAKKMREECTETFDAAVDLHMLLESYTNFPTHETFLQLKDGIGDLHVTGILLAEMAGFTTEECLQHAYDVISKRTGVMIDGTFVKDDESLIREDGSDDEFIIAHGQLMEEMLAEDAAKALEDDDFNEPLGERQCKGGEACESCQ